MCSRATLLKLLPAWRPRPMSSAIGSAHATEIRVELMGPHVTFEWWLCFPSGLLSKDVQ